MCVFKIWCVLCLFGFMSASLCVNEVEYDGNYAENYDNEIPQDQQEGERCLFILLSLLFPSCLNRWFIVKLLFSTATPDFTQQIKFFYVF